MTNNTTVYKGELFGNTTVNASSLRTNASLPPTTDPAPPQGIPELYLLLTTLFFSLIVFTGLFGNSLVVATLVRKREMRTPCNLLIANICAADLAVCVLAAPLRIIEIYRGWLFGDVMCYILTPLQDVFTAVSVVTHTVIALERHRAILAPFKPEMTLQRVKIAVLAIWIVCYLTAGVPMIGFLKNKLYGNGLYYCIPDFTDIHEGYRIAYEVYLVVLFIALPLVIQCAAYVGVIRELRAKNDDSSNNFDDRARQKRRPVRMLIVLMLTFQVCYLPRGVIMLMREFTPKTTSKPKFLYVDLITLAMYYFKHVINPFILWAMSNNFRACCLGLCLQ